jgi:hypothetical protein
MDGTVVDEMEISFPDRQVLKVCNHFHVAPDWENDFRDTFMPMNGISVDFLDFDPEGLSAAEFDFFCEHGIFSLTPE